MVLKRKRSESELSFSSTLSSPPRPDSSAFNLNTMGVEGWGLLSSRPSTPSHLPSRTMKRFRDNRPSESEVHQRTLNLLYSAQQLHPPAVAQQQPDIVMSASPSTETLARRDGQQRSLHSFWKLSVTAGPSTPFPLPTTPSSSPAQQNMSTCCEDCGAGLSDGSDMMMDVDGFGTDSHSCGACGKVVCFSCSVSSLGEHRRCLVCAKRTVWTGGIAFTTSIGAC